MRLIKYAALVSGCLMLLLALPLLAKDDDEEEPQEKVPVAYVKLPPSFITNVQQGAQYIRCDIQLLTKTADNVPDIELHAPALRHELLLLLSDQNGKELKSKNGQEKLRKTALKAVQGVLDKLAGKDLISDLFFTYYIVE